MVVSGFGALSAHLGEATAGPLAAVADAAGLGGAIAGRAVPAALPILPPIPIPTPIARAAYHGHVGVRVLAAPHAGIIAARGLGRRRLSATRGCDRDVPVEDWSWASRTRAEYGRSGSSWPDIPGLPAAALGA